MFKKAKVIYVLENPNIVNKTEEIEKALFKYNVSFFDILHPKINEISFRENISYFIDTLPSNTIICQEHYTDEDNFIIALPFMSSHFKMPIKIGEIVWLYKDNNEISELENISKINHYWLSRIHGTRDVEDANYTLLDREFSNKKDLYQESVEKESVILPEIKYNNFDNVSNINSKNISFEEILKKNNLKDKITIEAVPRYFNSQEDFHIQGSNNTLINLGKEEKQKNSGTISIIAGRKSNYRKFEKITLKNVKDEEDTEIFKNQNEDFFKIIHNISDIKIEENFKSVREFSNLKENTQLEGFNDFILDASILKVSEKLKSDFFLNKKTGIQKITNKEVHESEVKYLNNSNNFTKIKIKNKKDENFNFTREPCPTILGKSTNITFVATEEKQDSKNRAIRLINTNKDYEKYSHILIENEGNINIDSNNIFIGSFDREINKQGIDIKNTYTYEDFSSMHGNGSTINLGYKKEISEPIVLGNTLKSILEELLNVNIEIIKNINTALNEIKQNTEKITSDINRIQTTYDTHVHGPPGTPTVSLLLTTNSKLVVNSSKDKVLDNNKDIQIKRLEDISNNLNKILSRIVKSS